MARRPKLMLLPQHERGAEQSILALRAKGNLSQPRKKYQKCYKFRRG